ncbi:MAG: SsrA-binding protein SmpB [Verrucomicrobiota bacterium]|nr:SsrA-binding protein SmpB [Verrucomicrobiota bacterium]
MSGRKRIVKNKKAYYLYSVGDTIETGIVLLGTEVKSCRKGDVSVGDAYAQVEDGEVFLVGFHIAPYKEADQFNHNPLRKRKLLLHKREIAKLKAARDQKGMTLVPLELYFRNNKVKLSLGLCKGKNVADKRHALRDRTHRDEMKRAVSKY